MLLHWPPPSNLLRPLASRWLVDLSRSAELIDSIGNVLLTNKTIVRAQQVVKQSTQSKNLASESQYIYSVLG